MNGRACSWVVCPKCAGVIAAPRVMREGGFCRRCEDCGREWQVRVALFSISERLDGPAFRAALREGLEREGLTHTELARLLGVTPAYVSMVLNGKRLPGNAPKWLEAVGVR